MKQPDIFKNKVPDFKKLSSFGFVKDKDKYVYSRAIMDHQFDLIVCVAPDCPVQTKVIDRDTHEEYVLHLTDGSGGGFIGQVRGAYNQVLREIADNCFEKKVFQSEQALKIIEYIKGTYQNDFEFLWEKFPEYAIVRRSDNQKWYGILMRIEKNKIGLIGNEKIEVMDLRVSPEQIEQITDGKKYFLGYHMNKKHWVTLNLQEFNDMDEITGHIDASYILAAKA